MLFPVPGTPVSRLDPVEQTKSCGAMIAAERLGLADLFDGLTEAQWSVPSLCEGWTVRDVAAHLVTPFGQSLPRLVLKLASYRFDFDRFAFTEATAPTGSTG